jgi:hypothetical protein
VASAFLGEHLLLFLEQSSERRIHRIGRKHDALAASASVLLFAMLFAGAQDIPRKTVKPAVKSEPEVKEELILKNGDRLTGQLLNSTGAEIKFKTDLAGEVTVALADIKELKSRREFAVVPKDAKNRNDSALVPQGEIRIGEKGITVTPTPSTSLGLGASKVLAGMEVPNSRIDSIVDDTSYQKEIHKRIGLRSGWDGHISTGTTTILSTQDSYLFQVNTALKRTVPTVEWLDPKLRSIVNFTLSAGKTTQPDTPTTITNIYHVDGERDLYFSRQGYYLGALSFDHNFAQGLILQQDYGLGVGATLFKKNSSELDITTDLHYENQQFNATADVSQLTLNLVGSALAEAYTRKWNKLHFDEKLVADVAFNNAAAFSASGTSSVRVPVYKSLAFSVSIIDNFLNNP